MNKTLRLWLTVRQHRQAATRALLSLEPIERRQAVCEAMFHLNHLARQYRRTSFATAIYDLKTQLIKHLYLAGHCEACTLHHQELACYCGGEDEYCHKCGGTGVYRRLDLYYFRFNVGGRYFVWHQPVRRVTFPVTLTQPEPRDYEDRADAVAGYPAGFDADRALQLVNVYLQWYGLGESLPALPGVLLAIASDWLLDRRLVHNLIGQFYYYRDCLIDRIRGNQNQVQSSDEAIPF